MVPEGKHGDEGGDSAGAGAGAGAGEGEGGGEGGEGEGGEGGGGEGGEPARFEHGIFRKRETRRFSAFQVDPKPCLR